MVAADYDYLATRNQIIQAAFRIVGALGRGQTLSADKLQQGVDALQLLVKHWSNKHLFLWSFNETSFDTVAGTQGYAATLDQNIIGLDKAWVVDSDGNIQQYLEVISWSKYEDIYAKTSSSGVPVCIAYKSTPAPQFYVYPNPDAVYTVLALCAFPLKDMPNADDSGDLPARFQRALKYGLADDLLDEYPLSAGEMTRIARKAEQAFSEAKNADMPSQTNQEVEGLF